MKLAGLDADRIHGSLTVTLRDGREASLDIDIDVSDDRSFLEVQNHYNDEDRLHPILPVRLLSQTLSIHWPGNPHPLRGEEAPAPLVIRVPLPGT